MVSARATLTQYIDDTHIKTESFDYENKGENEALRNMKNEIEMFSFSDLVYVDSEDLRAATGLDIDDEGNFYDPLAEDLDNDGIPDRYDNDFKYSDYFESAYDAYMDNDTVNLLHEEFDYMIEDLREQGQIKDLPYVQEEKDNLINIVGEVDVVERENKNGEAFKVANFSVVSKDDEGNKVYHNCSAYGEKSDIPKYFKQGDFVKPFGQIITSIDDNDKEHSNIRISFLKLLKAKEQMRGRDEKKESVLGAIKKYQAEDKEKPKENKAANKEAER